MINFPKYRKAILDYQRTHFISDYQMSQSLGVRFSTYLKLHKHSDVNQFHIKTLKNIQSWIEKNISDIGD